MGMVIHDDYWEAMKLLPKAQRAPFLMAVVAYGMEGTQPEGRPPWLATFTAIRGRIELGAKRSASGAKGGSRNKQNRDLLNKQNGFAPQANGDFATEANGDFATEANGDLLEGQNGSLLSRVEDEDELGVGEEPPLPPFEPDGEAPFAWRCLGELNEALGTPYTSMPPKCERTLSRLEGEYGLAEVRRMVEYKRDEWRGTRFANCLTPNTLFSPEHFEQYMNQSRASAAERSEYERYD